MHYETNNTVACNAKSQRSAIFMVNRHFSYLIVTRQLQVTFVHKDTTDGVINIANVSLCSSRNKSKLTLISSFVVIILKCNFSLLIRWCCKVLNSVRHIMLTDCNSSQFRCDSGQCVTVRSMCDGISYCVDGSDQANCCEYRQINFSVYWSYLPFSYCIFHCEYIESEITWSERIILI